MYFTTVDSIKFFAPMLYAKITNASNWFWVIGTIIQFCTTNSAVAISARNKLVAAFSLIPSVNLSPASIKCPYPIVAPRGNGSFGATGFPVWSSYTTCLPFCLTQPSNCFKIAMPLLLNLIEYSFCEKMKIKKGGNAVQTSESIIP